LTQHSKTKLSASMLKVTILRFIDCYVECHYAEGCFAECHYAGCRYAECRYAE